MSLTAGLRSLMPHKKNLMTPHTRLLHGTVTLLMLLFAQVNCGAFAADAPYPSRPIRLILPVAAGGGGNVFAQILTPKLQDVLGQPWVIDNRGGAGGNIAMEITAHAAPDGYTVLQAANTYLTVNPHVYKLSFSVEKDLQPVVLLATAPLIMVAHPSVRADNLKEFIALAKQHPGTLNFASSGVGGPLHLAGELFKLRAGINMVHIAYKGGGPAAAAVLSGEAQILFASSATSIPQIKAGKLKAIANATGKRSALMPELPTIAESGFPGFDGSFWYAYLVPARTPAAIVKRLYDESAKALQLPDVQQALARQGLESSVGTPQELAARIGTESATMAKLVKEAGIRGE